MKMELPPEHLEVSSGTGNSTRLPLWLRVALVVLGIIFWLVVRSWLSPGPVSVSEGPLNFLPNSAVQHEVQQPFSLKGA